MGIAITLREYLDRSGVRYDVVEHPHTYSASETAQVSHIPGDQLAKSVVLEDEDGYLMAVIPATHRVEIGKLHKQLHRQLGLATEHELELLFDDCETGAVPPIGQAYGLDVVVDDAIVENPDIYFEAGDHRDLVHVSGEDFRALMNNAGHGRFSHHV